MLYQFNSKRRGSAQEIKTSHATHIQAPKTEFRCYVHDLRWTKNSQVPNFITFFNMTIDKFSKLDHFNREIKFGPIIFL
jgi:hypothetical protein